MSLSREDVNFESIKSEADADLLVENIMLTIRIISRFQDRQVKMSDEKEEHKETINNIRLLEKEKRWNMLWRNSLGENIAKTQVLLVIAFSINIIFAYLISH
ncbi:hypothetical protein [Leuconostoc mesenteroides]|mgnify:CR=1 FL=1|uniref:hypothetical protein n=1 Tax=Leuconostoc mesenteroides TaxID=1245 RepID=UPI001FB9E666|nr:hypothetical protein [Leuconostoc mesenteroides]MCJ2158602.1 hypothetical protein [Leuconostoc mesenteroides]MCM6835973.1 hypothetical protein [Leuconostoc mesenteroides]